MLASLLALLLALLGFGVTAGPPAPAPTSISIDVGETVEIGIGETNYSARSHPVIVGEPDSAVVSIETEDGPAPAGCEPGGCWNPTTAKITGLAPGTTEFTVQKCFVENTDSCQPQADPVTYTVTVG